MVDGVMSRDAWVREALGRYEKPLIAYACRITGEIETARDVVQDTFLKLCTADRAVVDGHLAPWLYTVCRNRALDVQRKNGRMHVVSENEARSVASRAPAPSVLASRHEAHERVLEAVAALPEVEQWVFQLKFGDGLTYREISEITGVSLATISKRMNQALHTLRESLRGHVDLATER
jgi:RNA polymerase sigma-70 factor (ECF subfamily)